MTRRRCTSGRHVCCGSPGGGSGGGYSSLHAAKVDKKMTHQSTLKAGDKEVGGRRRRWRINRGGGPGGCKAVAWGNAVAVMQQLVRVDDKGQRRDDKWRHQQTGGGSVSRCNTTTSQDGWVTTTPENERGTKGGNTTTSWRIERRQRVERMSGKGSVMRSDGTTSQGKREAIGSERWRRWVKRQQCPKRTSCREAGQQDAPLQPAGALRGMVAGQEDGWQRRCNKKQRDN